MAAAKTSIKSMVGQKALVMRLNRKLAGKHLSVRRPRSVSGFASLGDWFLLDEQRSVIVQRDVNLAELGIQYGVLEPWEAVEGYAEVRK
jgi:hypothetical protein